jgi:hypothetical protein
LNRRIIEQLKHQTASVVLFSIFGVRNGTDQRMSSASSQTSNAGESFTASRWTRGNLFFPTRIVVSPLHVSRVKPRLFGKTEESIAVSQVASVEIRTGVIWSEIRIDSTGGADPITSHGHRKRDAIRIRELIENYQAQRAKGIG